MPHFDYTISLGTMIHLVSLLVGGVLLYAKIIARQDKIETLFTDAVRRFTIVEQRLMEHSGSLQRLIGQCDVVLSRFARRDAADD